MKITSSAILFGFFSIGLLVGCNNEDDDIISSRISGTWNSPNPTYQYLDENDNILYEEPFGELQGEITFDNNIIAIIEPDGNVYSGTYATTEASGKLFIVVVINGDTESIEASSPSINQMILTGFERSDTGYTDESEEGYNFHPAARSRLHSLLTKK